MSDEPLKAVTAWLRRKDSIGGPIGIIVGAFVLAAVSCCVLASILWKSTGR